MYIYLQSIRAVTDKLDSEQSFARKQKRIRTPHRYNDRNKRNKQHRVCACVCVCVCIIVRRKTVLSALI